LGFRIEICTYANALKCTEMFTTVCDEQWRIQGGRGN